MHLRDVYGECFFLIEPHEQLTPLQCFETECQANKNCGEVIARRVNFLFERVLNEDVKLLIAYFKYRDRPNSIRGAIFTRDMDDPSVKILNVSGFYKCRDEGKVYQWVPSDEFLLMGSNSKGIIPVDNLIRGS